MDGDITTPAMAGGGLDLLRWQFAFMAWARPRVLSAAAGLDEERLRRPGMIPGGVGDGSLLATLAHIADAEETWLARWMGKPEPPEENPALAGGLDAVARHWWAIEQERAGWLARIDPAELMRLFRRYTGANGSVAETPLWPALVHLINHTTHHRAEACAALTALGSPPAGLDVMDFVRDTAGVTAPYDVEAIPRQTP